MELRLHETPSRAVTTSETVLANPLSGVMTIPTVPGLPASILTVLELVDIVKSGAFVRVTVTTILITWERDLLDPMIATV